MDTWLWFFNIINTFIITDYLRRTYGYKYEQRYINITAIIVFYFVHTLINLERDVQLNIASEFIIINLTSYLLFKEKNGRFYFNCMLQLYLIAIDLIVSGLFSVALELDFNVLKFTNTMVLSTFIAITITLVTYRRVIKLFEHDFSHFGTKKRILLSVIVIAQFAFVFSMSKYFTHFESVVAGIVLMIYITAINTSILYCIIMHTRNMENVQLSRFQSAYIDAAVKQMQTEDARMETLSRIFLKHNNKTVKTSENEHLKEIQGQINKVIVKYSDPTLNALMNHARLRAQSMGINLKESIEQTEWDFINSNDLVILLSTLIDNAMSTINGGKNMEITIRDYHTMRGIEIRHDCNMVGAEKAGRVIYPDKTEEVKMRTKIATEIITKLDADINFTIEENVFTAMITLTTNRE